MLTICILDGYNLVGAVPLCCSDKPLKALRLICFDQCGSLCPLLCIRYGRWPVQVLRQVTQMARLITHEILPYFSSE